MCIRDRVLKDVPALKPSTENNEGFQIGAGQQTNGQQSSAGSNVNAVSYTHLSLI